MNLLIRPKPEPDEGLLGYILRLTELNGYDTPSWILSLSGIDYMELQWNFTFVFSRSDGLQKLATLTGMPVSGLEPLLYLPADSSVGHGIEDEYNFYGAFLNRSVIRPHCPKVCPTCLSEYGYSLRVWDCSLVTACPTHGCMLIDSCPECKSRTMCVRKSLAVCSCGYDWRETDPRFIPERELAVSRRIYGLCGLLPTEHVLSGKEINNPLNGLGLRDFALVMTFIAGLDGKMAWATGRPAKSIKLRNDDLHKRFTRAYRVFENWPRNFHQFLQEYSKEESELSRFDGKLDTALKREFGSLYEHLYENLDGCQFEFMREAFANFLTDRLRSKSLQPHRITSTSPSGDTDKYVSVTEARRLLRITHRAMSDLISAGEVEFVIRNERATLKHLLRLSDVENLKSKFGRAVSSRALAKELGVDCKVVRELGQSGILKTRWRPAVDGLRTIKFDRDAAQELLNRLSHPILGACESDDHEILDFSEASKLCNSLGVTVADLVKAIANGEVRPCAVIQSPGFGRFLFHTTCLFGNLRGTNSTEVTERTTRSSATEAINFLVPKTPQLLSKIGGKLDREETSKLCAKTVGTSHVMPEQNFT